MNKVTQIKKIVDYINEHGSITDNQAVRRLGVGRLASRIWDMKQLGYSIDKKTIKVRGRDGSASYVARYSWAENEEAAQ